MKNLMKFMVVTTIVLFSTNTFAEELGLRMSNLTSSYAAPKASKKSSGAKAFEGKGSKTLSIGLGMSSYLGVFGSGGYSSYSGYYGVGYGFWYSGTLSLQAEFGVHDYVGVGLVTGVGGRGNRRLGGGGVLYVPVGIFANFHFFQLIEDKTSRDIHADKIDLYAGLNVGSGLAVSFPASSSTIGGMLFVGPQVGIKYYPKPKFGIYAEVGYGKSLLEAGISLKL